MNKASVEKTVSELLSKLTLEEKVSLCHAASNFTVAAIPRAGIPALTMSDGPHGVRRELVVDGWDPLECDFDFATYLPTGTALAATWSRDCARKFGETLGAEARERGKDIILGPGVNIVRSPLCGRNFEYYSEDPFLISEMAVPAIKGIQAQDTAACVKHYALNNQELNRGAVDVHVSERALREIYLPGFEAAVKRGKVLSVMGSYNKFHGQHCCHNDYLLNCILKGEWGFDGAVVSDWGGAHDDFEAACNGLDIEMGTGRNYAEYHLANPLLKAVKEGLIEEEVLNDKARRTLRVMVKAGCFKANRKKGSRNTKKHQRTALAIAEEAIVLLKNERNVLPLDANKVKSLLVVGENATFKHHAGGNSSAVKALYEVSPLEGLKKLLEGKAEVKYIQGYPELGEAGSPIPTDCIALADEKAGSKGWVAKFYANRDFAGEPKLVTLADAALDMENGLPPWVESPNYACRIETVFTAPATETWTFILSDCHHAGFSIDGNWTIMRCETEGAPTSSMDFALEKGRKYKFSVEIRPHLTHALAPCRLSVLKPGDARTGGSAELLDAAKKAGAVLFFGGLNHLYDVEGCDRKDMKLHNGQNELIARLAAANPRFAAIMVGGSPVEMPWVKEVPAILQMWYAGMECGDAIAKILFGETNPSGKLPFTFPKALEDSPAHQIGDYAADVCRYREGVFVGYRWFDAKSIEPLFPFGHGLSYSQFEYSSLEIEKNAKKGAKVRFSVKNIGGTAGKEVAQLYLGDCESSVPRPPLELKGFDKVSLQPGESATVELPLVERDFAFFHPVLRKWIVEPGEFTVAVGASSRDLRLKKTFTL